MSMAANGTSISISIDTGSLGSSSSVSSDAMDSVLTEIFSCFQKQRLAATWMIENPCRHALTERISRHHHELALSGTPAVVPSGMAENQTNSTTLGRLLECRRGGLNVSTVAEDGTHQQRDIDLLAKHGITIIRSAASAGSHRLQALRYGVWYVPACATLGGGWMPYFAQLQTIKRTIEQTLRKTNICHVRIDVGSLVRSDIANGLRAIERLLSHLNQLQSTRTIAVETLHKVAIRLQPKRTATSAKSILRAA